MDPLIKELTLALGHHLKNQADTDVLRTVVAKIDVSFPCFFFYTFYRVNGHQKWLKVWQARNCNHIYTVVLAVQKALHFSVTLRS